MHVAPSHRQRINECADAPRQIAGGPVEKRYLKKKMNALINMTLPNLVLRQGEKSGVMCIMKTNKKLK